MLETIKRLIGYRPVESTACDAIQTASADCPNSRLLWDFVFGCLSLSEEETVRGHVLSCDACREATQSISRMVSTV